MYRPSSFRLRRNDAPEREIYDSSKNISTNKKIDLTDGTETVQNAEERIHPFKTPCKNGMFSIFGINFAFDDLLLIGVIIIFFMEKAEDDMLIAALLFLLIAGWE